MKFLDDWKIIMVLCLTLGLAPFSPEPHIWGKLKWIAGGAEGMQLIDWWDTFLHGFPYILLFRLIYLKVFSNNTEQKPSPGK